MTYVLYNILLHVTVLILSPFLLFLYFFNAFNLRQRLGSWEYAPASSATKTVWFHAASMGEVMVLATVVNEINTAFPHLGVVVSTTTVTGQTRVRELIPSAACIFLLPLDIPWVLHRIIRRLRPHALILAETELWPNLIVRTKRSGAQVVLINGRMSEKSVRRYRPVTGLLKQTLRCFDLVCVQTERDRDRFVTFGADQEKIAILGNIKFDLHRFLTTLKTSGLTKASLGIAADARIVVAGSTRPGEEGILLSHFHRVKENQDTCVLIIAPRHLDRVGEVEALVSAHNLECVRRSRLDASTSFNADVILVDTMGELSHIYALADVAFVGGTLVPLGGHNPLEPAMWGVPVLFGPHRDNVRQITDLLIQEHGGMEIKDGEAFAATLLRLLRDPDERRKRGEAAHRVVETNAGVSTRTTQLLRERGIV